MTDPAAPSELTYQERATLQDLYDWSDRLTDDWLGLGERLRRYADAWKAHVDELRAEVERLGSGWLTDEQCDDVIEFLEDYEWTGLTRENVRTWSAAIESARASVSKGET